MKFERTNKPEEALLTIKKGIKSEYKEWGKVDDFILLIHSNIAEFVEVSALMMGDRGLEETDATTIVNMKEINTRLKIKAQGTSQRFGFQIHAEIDDEGFERDYSLWLDVELEDGEIFYTVEYITSKF